LARHARSSGLIRRCQRRSSRAQRLDRFLPPFRPVRLRGTLAPFFRASERPIAIACLRLVTLPPFPPRPDFSVPFFRRRIALSTRFDAADPYLLRPEDFLAAIRILPELNVVTTSEPIGACCARE